MLICCALLVVVTAQGQEMMATIPMMEDVSMEEVMMLSEDLNMIINITVKETEQAVDGCACGDNPPDEKFTCQQQKDFGKCGSEFMNGYCQCTCETCGQTKSKKSSGICLAVFDFDDTLKLHFPPRNAPDAESVVQQSLDLNYGIAVASASCTYDYLKDYLKTNILPGFFNDEFYNSNRFRICNTWKRSSLEDIIDYYGGSFECTMFFDDSNYGWQFEDTELVFTQVVRGVGVTLDNFQSANERMLKQCNCVAAA